MTAIIGHTPSPTSSPLPSPPCPNHLDNRISAAASVRFEMGCAWGQVARRSLPARLPETNTIGLSAPAPHVLRGGVE